MSINGSGTSTPVLAAGIPDLQSLNKKVFNTHSPGNTTNARLTNNSVTAVRDVSVTPKHTNMAAQAKYNKINSSSGPFPNFRQQTSINLVKGREDASNRFNNIHASTLNRNPPQLNTADSLKNSSRDFKPTGSGTGKWKFRSPSSTSVSSPSPNANSVNFNSKDNSNSGCIQNRGSLLNTGNKDLGRVNNRPAVSGRSCQLQAISSVETSEKVITTTNSTNNSFRKQRNVIVPSTDSGKGDTTTSKQESDLWEDGEFSVTIQNFNDP